MFSASTTELQASQRRGLLKSLSAIALSQWLLLAMGVVILLAHFFPSVGKRGGVIRSEYSIDYGAVAVIFLVSGLSIPFDQLARFCKAWRLHLIVQVSSFFLASALFFAVAAAASTNSTIETSVLIGLVATGCLPTTIASNVVMTRQAGGNVAATTIEVAIGNLLGPILSPILLLKVFLPSIGRFQPWLPYGGHSQDLLGKLLPPVLKQMGLSVYVPLLVGQLLRNIWPKQISGVMEKFQLAKLGSLCMLSLIWSTFCTAFASKSLESLSPPSVVFSLFTNLLICVTLTAYSFLVSYPPTTISTRFPRIFPRFDPLEVVSVCFCAPAKSQAVGIPLIAAMYAHSDDTTRSLIQVPMILYTAEQILVGQGLVAWCRRWLAQHKSAEVTEESTREESTGGVMDSSDTLSKTESQPATIDP